MKQETLGKNLRQMIYFCQIVLGSEIEKTRRYFVQERGSCIYLSNGLDWKRSWVSERCWSNFKQYTLLLLCCKHKLYFVDSKNCANVRTFWWKRQWYDHTVKDTLDQLSSKRWVVFQLEPSDSSTAVPNLLICKFWPSTSNIGHRLDRL